MPQDNRQTIATACRILAMLGLVRETTGHVSARIDDRRMLLRCRGTSEVGLMETAPEAVKSVAFDGTDLEDGDAYETPTELPIHGELYRSRPDAIGVVHAHPRASMMCTILGLELRPIFGAFDPNAMFLAADGVPLFPRSSLIRDTASGQALVSAMEDKSACLLYGHGIVTIGRSVEEATIKAIQLETLASITLECAKSGKLPDVISEEDREYFRKMREASSAKAAAHAADVTNWTWGHYCRLLEIHEGRSA